MTKAILVVCMTVSASVAMGGCSSVSTKREYARSAEYEERETVVCNKSLSD